MRDDLSLGLLVAQVVHAAGESSPGNIPSGTHAVVLGCKAPELQELGRKLALGGVPHILIHEDDGMLTAIGIKPAPKSVLRPYLRDYKLLREVSQQAA